MTCEDTAKSTFSPESEAGPSPSASPDGQTIGQPGPAPVPVSRFRALASDRETPMPDTSGPLFSASSPSAALQWSLESKLQANLDGNGSPEYALTWSHWSMPLGLPICRLRASARRTSDKDSFGRLPTPTAAMGKRGWGFSKTGRRRYSQEATANAMQYGWRPPISLVNAMMGFPEEWDACAPTATPSPRR